MKKKIQVQKYLFVYTTTLMTWLLIHMFHLRKGVILFSKAIMGIDLWWRCFKFRLFWQALEHSSKQIPKLWIGKRVFRHSSNMSYMNHCPSINFRLYFFMSSFAEDHRDDNISVWMKCWYLRLEIHTIIMTYDLSKNDDHNDRLDNNTKIFMFSMFFFRFCFHCPFDCSAESVQRCVWSFFSIALKSCCLSVEKIYSIVITINFV